MRTAITIESAPAASSTLTVSGLLSHVAKAIVVRRERRALLALDDRMLADVGLSRADAHREAHRPFLDVSSAMTNQR